MPALSRAAHPRRGLSALQERGAAVRHAAQCPGTEKTDHALQTLTGDNSMTITADLWFALACGIVAILYGVISVGDRKSTRLNSSHHSISYAVFCLKKK